MPNFRNTTVLLHKGLSRLSPSSSSDILLQLPCTQLWSFVTFPVAFEQCQGLLFSLKKKNANSCISTSLFHIIHVLSGNKFAIRQDFYLLRQMFERVWSRYIKKFLKAALESWVTYKLKVVKKKDGQLFQLYSIWLVTRARELSRAAS